MDNLILSFNVIFPLFVTMALGYILKQLKMFDEKTLKIMNNLVFKVFLPILLFNNIYNTNLKDSFNIKLLSFCIISVIISFLLVTLIVPIIEKNNKKRGVMIQGIFRSNFVLFGLPVAISLFGEGQAGVIAILISVVVPMFNMLSVIALEIFRGGSINIKKIIKGIITNPLIIASALGLSMLLLNIKFPIFITKSISDISKIATPLSLILLGGSFNFCDIKTHIKQTSICVLGKLILLPIIMIPIGIYLGFRNIELVGIMLIFASPTAVSSFTMAQKMDGDDDLAAQIVVFTSAFCIITVFLWIFILKQFSFI